MDGLGCVFSLSVLDRSFARLTSYTFVTSPSHLPSYLSLLAPEQCDAQSLPALLSLYPVYFNLSAPCLTILHSPRYVAALNVHLSFVVP